MACTARRRRRGATSASRRRRLDLAAESARLAAVLPNPKQLKVEAPSAYVLRRQAWIQRQVRQLGGPDYLGGSE
jgi:hypothetical protein